MLEKIDLSFNVGEENCSMEILKTLCLKKNQYRGHIQCDSIIMDQAVVSRNVLRGMFIF